MSDYFSLPPRGADGSRGGTPYGTPGEDSLSERSSRRSSQYFLDSGHHSGDSEQILSQDDKRSPYYVGVPVPTGVQIDPYAGSGGTDEHEGKYVREFPTDVLVDRFKKWRKILKGIANYLREVAFAQEQFAKINFQLKSSVKFPFLTDLEDGTNKIVDPFDPKPALAKRQQPLTVAQQREQKQLQEQQEYLQALEQQQEATQPQAATPSAHRDFSDDRAIGTDDIQVVKTDSESAAPSGFLKFGSGSIQDIQVVLKKYHLSLAAQQLKISKEITSTILPRLDDLRRDLHLKTKEIKELSGDFKTNINEHVAITGQFLNRYVSSVKYMVTNVAEGDHIKLQKKGTQIKPKHDPYLLKLQLDLQIKRQLLEESYLREAYVNIQSSGLELEKIVLGKVQQILQRYSSLLDAEARLTIKNLCRELQQGILSKPTAFEWDKFVGHHPSCLMDWKSTEPYPSARKLSDVVYPQMKSPLAKCIRAGYLTKKSKYLRNYGKGYFVLTSNYLHEFKSSNFFSTALQEENQSTSLTATQAAKTSLVPIMSIALNDCVLTEASDEKFVLVGKPTFNDIEVSARLSSASGKTSKAFSHDLKSKEGEKLSKHTKKTIGKLWKSAKPGGVSGHSNGLEDTKQHASSPKIEYNEEKVNYQAMIEQEGSKTVSWSFRPVSSNQTEEEVKQFRKWAHDLKNLTTFNNAKDRSKFIEERILKANHRRSTHLKHVGSNTSMMTMLDNARSDGQHKRSGRPTHISLNNGGGIPVELMSRSKCNTPAVDDNGNLITVGERRHISNNTNAFTNSPLPSPRYVEKSSVTSPPISQSQFLPGITPGMTITSKGISPSATVLNAAPVGMSPSLSRKSSSGLKSPVTGITPPSITSGSGSVNSAHSEGSGGGYFAIPVGSNNEESSSQASTPASSFVDAPAQQSQAPSSTSPASLSHTDSNPSLSRQYPLGIQELQSPAVQKSTTRASPLPRMRLNDQEFHHAHSNQPDVQPFPLTIQSPPTLRRNVSSGDIPVTKGDISAGTVGSIGNTLYQSRGNGSQSSLNATSPRIHAIRKHKKNVSFGSLNSLVFKKSSNAATNQSAGQLAGGIQEDEADDDSSQTIKLHRSIYSE